MNRLIDYLFRVIPDAVELHHQRFYQFLVYIILLSAVGHFCFIPLFYGLGVTPLVIYNMCSVVLFVIVFALNRRGMHYIAMLLMVGEFVGHATLAVHYVGWQFGFQYYMIGWAFVPFFAPSGHRIPKLSIFCISCASIVLLYEYSVGRPVPHDWNSGIVIGINTVNIMFNSGVLAVAFVYFRTLVDSAEEKLETEYERSEELIRHMLPDKIAYRLKNEPRSIAESFEEVSVLFLDIVAFTPLAESMLARSVVEMLNNIFSDLDALAEKYGLEKIKTIGDAYMVAAGIPQRGAKDYHAIGQFALEANSALSEYINRDGKPMEFRIGLNSGPLVAGVIGTKKYSYDLWGDTVNTAARMESHGEPGRIQCTRAYMEMAKEYFEFERRGQVEIKGKGHMETFFLIGKKGEGSNFVEESRTA